MDCGPADCDLVNEMSSIGIGSSTLRSTNEAALALSKAADETKLNFLYISDQSDEKMWQMYKGLARLTARLMQSYYSDLGRLDKMAAEHFLSKLNLKLWGYGCPRSLRRIPPSIPKGAFARYSARISRGRNIAF